MHLPKRPVIILRQKASGAGGLFLWVALMCGFSSCAKKEIAEVRPVAVVSVKVPEVRSKPVPKPSAEPPAPARPLATPVLPVRVVGAPPPALAVPSPSPATLAALVRRGKAVPGGAPGKVTFTSNGNAGTAAAPALFEDAIILNRVRAAIKALPMPSAEIADSVKVSGGRVTLVLPTGMSHAAAAGVIDAALSSEGVSAVSANAL